MAVNRQKYQKVKKVCFFDDLICNGIMLIQNVYDVAGHKL